jgi:hypothetical protein
MGEMTAVREGGAIELVFFWGGASGSTMAGVSAGGGEGGVADWLDKMVGPRGVPLGSGSSFRERAFGAAASDAVFFIGGGGTIALAGIGALVSTGFVSVAGADSGGFTAEEISAGTASRAVTCAEPSSGGRDSNSSAAAAPAAATAPDSRASLITGSLLSNGFGGTAGGAGGVLLGKSDAIKPVRTLGGGVAGALALAVAGGGMTAGSAGGVAGAGEGIAGVVATGGGTRGTARGAGTAGLAGGGGSEGAPEADVPNIGADFFCGGGNGGEFAFAAAGGGISTCAGGAGSDGVGAPKMGADWALGAAAPNIGADFLCGGGGKGDALAADAGAGAPKIWDVFFCGGEKGGALGVDAAAALPKTWEVFFCGGGEGGALEEEEGAPNIGADFFCGGGAAGALAAADGGVVVGLISGPVLGRGGGKGEVNSDEVFVFGGAALSGVESDPVLGRGGGKGGVGSAPVRGRGNGEVASPAGAASGGGTRKEAVSRLICVGTPEGRPGDVLPEEVGRATGCVAFFEPGV